MKKYPNLYMCTCAGLQYRGMEDMVRRLGADRILFGSDSVIFDPAYGIGPVAFADISEQEKRQILGENALKLLAQIKPVTEQ